MKAGAPFYAAGPILERAVSRCALFSPTILASRFAIFTASPHDRQLTASRSLSPWRMMTLSRPSGRATRRALGRHGYAAGGLALLIG